MAKVHGLVLKIERKQMTVLTDLGDFMILPIPSPAPRIGQKIWLRHPQAHSLLAWFGGLAAAAALVLALQGFPFRTLPTAVTAAIALDINPSLVLQLDAHGNTVNLLPLNDDAARLRRPPPGMPLTDALILLLTSAREQGYIRQGEFPIILYSAYAESAAAAVPNLEAALEEAVARSKVEVRLVSLHPVKSQWQRAYREHSSVNHMAVIAQAEAQAIKVAPADLRGERLEAVLKRVGLLPTPAPPSQPPRLEIPASDDRSAAPPATSAGPPAAKRPEPERREIWGPSQLPSSSAGASTTAQSAQPQVPPAEPPRGSPVIGAPTATSSPGPTEVPPVSSPHQSGSTSGGAPTTSYPSGSSQPATPSGSSSTTSGSGTTQPTTSSPSPSTDSSPTGSAPPSSTSTAPTTTTTPSSTSPSSPSSGSTSTGTTIPGSPSSDPYSPGGW